MTTLKDNPVPEGIYWSDIVGPDAIAQWKAYLEAVNREKDRIRILKTVHHTPASGGADSSIPGVDTILEALGEGTAVETPEREWVLWQALVPLVWDYSTLPAINTAEGVRSEEDTVQRPPPEQGVLTTAGESLETAGTVAKVVVGVVVAGGLAWLLSKAFERRSA